MAKNKRRNKGQTSSPYNLTLGWRLTESGELTPPKKVRDGSTTDDHLICVKGESLRHHTAIVGQSGSRKSSFLARLIEELLICTRARCIILDPNADFRYFGEPEIVSKFEQRQRGSPSKIAVDEKFEACWSHLTPKVYFGKVPASGRNWTPLKLPWPILSLDAIATGDDTPTAREELDICHRFIRAICYLMAFQHKNANGAIQQSEPNRDSDMLDWSEHLLDTTRNNNKRIFERNLREAINGRFAHVPQLAAIELNTPFLRHTVPIEGTRDEIINGAIKYALKFSADTQKRYFLRAARYKDYGFIETKIHELIRKNEAGSKTKYKEIQERIEIVDLPSFDNEVKLDAVNGVLELIWKNSELEWSDAMKSREGIRAPTFIIVEEAHNLIPEKSDNFFAEIVRDQFRRIAAEGRKYEQFLIICTQRPDKIDPYVVSECENIAIMKLGSDSVLDASVKQFGLDGLSRSDLALCLEFGKDKGDALLAGPWTQLSQLSQPLRLRAGLRRSKESTNPMQESWATPTPEIYNILQRKGRNTGKSKLGGVEIDIVRELRPEGRSSRSPTRASRLRKR